MDNPARYDNDHMPQQCLCNMCNAHSLACAKSRCHCYNAMLHMAFHPHKHAQRDMW